MFSKVQVPFSESIKLGIGRERANESKCIFMISACLRYPQLNKGYILLKKDHAFKRYTILFKCMENIVKMSVHAKVNDEKMKFKTT